MVPNTKRICNMLDWERPNTRTKLQRMMGIVNFFRRFLPNATALMTPWMKIKGKEFVWEQQPGAEEAYKAIYDALMSSGAFLQFPLSNVPFELATDASETGIGAILFQRGEDGIRYIGFNSRVLKDAEKRYSVPKKELISILYHVKYYREYLLGKPFILHRLTGIGNYNE